MNGEGSCTYENPEIEQATDDSKDESAVPVRETGGRRSSELVMPVASYDCAMINLHVAPYNTDTAEHEFDGDDTTAKVSPQLLKQLMTEGMRVAIAHFLLIIGGLPGCGKSVLLKNLLSNVVKRPQENVMKGIKSHSGIARMDYYELAALGPTKHNNNRVHYTDTTRETYYRYAFESALRMHCFEENKITQIYEALNKDVSIFGDAQLDNHFCDIYESLRQNHMQTKGNDEKPPWLLSVPDKFAIINIWDLGISKSVYHFVSAFCGCFYNSYVWSFLDLQRDVHVKIDALHQKLSKQDLPPHMEMNESDGFLRWHSRLRYYVRSASFTKSETQAAGAGKCMLFAAHDSGMGDREKCEALEFLNNQVKDTAAYFKVSKLIANPGDVVVVEKSKIESTKKIKEFSDEIIKSELKEPPKIPLSYIFLRTIFYKEKELYTTKDHLREKANKLHISEENFEDFCKIFTSFGSIFDMSLIDLKCSYVITKPMGFICELDKLFYPKANTIIARHGLVTEEEVQELFQEHAYFFMEVLCAVRAAFKVESARVSLQDGTLSGEYCYFVPGARATNPDTNCKGAVLHLMHSMAVPVKKFLLTFLKAFMDDDKTSKLMCLGDEAPSNTITIRAFPDDVQQHIDITAVRIGDSIEFRLYPEDIVSKKICCFVIKTCLAVMKTANFDKTKFNFSFICCLKAVEQTALNRTRHIFARDQKECCHCKQKGIYENEIIKTWKEVIEKFEIDNEIDTDRIMNGEPLNEDDLMMIIKKMKSAKNTDIWNKLLPKLKEKLELNEEIIPDEKWKCLLTMILNWERKQRPDKHDISKKEFARLLYSAAAESLDKAEIDQIKEVVRALDMKAIPTI